MKRVFLFFLLLSTFSFSSLVWQFNANGEVDTRPLVFSNSILVASSDGSIDLLNPVSGSKIWEKKVSGTPVQPVIFQGKALIATTNGDVALFGTDGSKQWETDLNASKNVTFVYGLDVSANTVYISSDKGILTLSAAGANATIIYNSSTLRTPPTVSGNSILFGDGDYLIKIGTSGNLEWKKNVGGTWRSKPVVEGSGVYVGGLDKKMHSLLLSNGGEKWAIETGNWVLSTPLLEGGKAYFGSNDGYVYAVSQVDGSIYWNTKGLLALQGQPESGMLGGTEAIFASGTDGSVYAFDSETGDILWRSPLAKWASDPLYYQNNIIFGSKDRTVSAYSTERACSIKTPSDAEILGLKEVKVTGGAVSESGSPTVEVQVNTGSFEKATQNGSNWVYYIDPSKSFISGINTISCRVSDSSGSESGTYTSVDVIYDPTIPKSSLIVTTSGSKLEGESLAMYVNDGTDGSPVERFSLSLNGLSYNGSEFVNITAPSGGSYQLIVKKIGYDDSVQKLDIYSKGISPLIILAVAAIIVIIAWQAYPRLVKKG